MLLDSFFYAAALQPAVEAEFARAHGVVPGGHLAVVAYGKLGSRELTLTSDLDLVFLYETPEGVETSMQRDTLSRMGCRLFQGYYMGAPMTVQEIEERLEAQQIRAFNTLLSTGLSDQAV